MAEDAPIYSFDTQGGALLVFENKVRISRSGCLSFMRHGAKGDKDILISSITAMQLKEPGLTGSGYLQFNLSGGETSTGGVFDATEDENTVMLKNKKQYREAKEAKQTIEKLMQERGSNGGNEEGTSSDAEELEKYHNLLERGAITEEEYEQKKREIFGEGESKASESNLQDATSQTETPEEQRSADSSEISAGEPVSSKQLEDSQGHSWYDRSWVVVALAFFFWPVAVYALYKNERMSTAGKFGTGVLCFFMAFATFGAVVEPEDTSTTQQQESVVEDGSESGAEPDANEPISTTTRYVHSAVNVRAEPTTGSSVVETIDRGSSLQVRVSDSENGWLPVYEGQEEVGYVAGNLLEEAPLPDVEIADWNWRIDPDFGTDGTVRYTVELRNNTSQYIEQVSVEFSTYDAQGSLIESTFTYVSGLSPGGTASESGFATYYGSEEKAKIRVDPSSF